MCTKYKYCAINGVKKWNFYAMFAAKISTLATNLYRHALFAKTYIGDGTMNIRMCRKPFTWLCFHRTLTKAFIKSSYICFMYNC